MQISKLVILLPSLSSMTAAPQQTQLFLKLYIFIQDLQWPAFLRLSSPQRKDQICVLYIERKKKKRCLQLTDSAICTYQLQMKKVSKVATNTPMKYFKLNKNIKNNTVFL